MAKVDLSTARAAKPRLAAKVKGHPQVSGIGIKPMGGKYALMVNLLRDAPDLSVPAQVDGVDVVVEITGAGFPQASQQ